MAPEPAPPPRRAPIEPSAIDLSRLLSLMPFRVPRYQRAYDWDTEEVSDFLGDLRRLYEQRFRGEPAIWHFFGALISVSRGDHYEVVDGQQRLATLVVALNELLTRVNSVESDAQAAGDQESVDLARGASERLRANLTAASEPRLVLSRRDKQYFEELLAGTASRPARGGEQSHKRLFAARGLVTDFLRSVDEDGLALDERVKRLSILTSAILENGYVVHLHTTEVHEAYRLFSVLNDRGRPLSDGALLRTHTLAVLEDFEAQQQAVELDWDEILHEGERYVDRFLAAFYVSHSGQRPPKGGMFDAFRAHFSEYFPDDRVTTAAEADAIRAFIDGLRAESELFGTLRSGEWPYENGTAPHWDRDRLARLVNILSHDLAFPLLLAVARRCNERRFVYLVLLLDRFVFRYINVAGGSPAALASIYYEHAKRVRDTGRLDSNRLENQLRELQRRYAGDDIFGLALQERLRYTTAPARNRILKHFLTTLEDHYSWYHGGASGRPRANKHSVFDLTRVTLEHVYPQTPDTADAALDPEKHHLGNMTLLDERDGRVAGHEPFEDKKAVYENSRIDLTRELVNIPAWTPDVIRQRAATYAEMAKKIFVV